MKKKYVAVIYRLLTIMISSYGLARYLGFFQGRIKIKYFAYYTVQSNILVLMYFVVAFVYMIKYWNTISSKNISPFYFVKGGMTFAITITAFVYNIVLVPLLVRMGNYKPYGFVDCIIHLYIPALAIMDWMVFDHKPVYKILDPMKWQMIPILYFIFTLVRAKVGGLLTPTSRYPYFFIDIDQYGIQIVTRNVIISLCCFIILAYTFYGIDVLLGRMKKRETIM